MEVNYRWKKHYKTAKYPIRQPAWLTWVIWILSKICLIGKDYSLETIDMEGLEPPYIIFSNHMAFIDFELAAMVTHPNKVNNVVNIDGYHMMPWLLTWIGSICTRKFTNDIHLVKSIRRVIQNGDILTQIQSEQIKTIRDFQSVMESMESGAEITVVIQRKGSNGYKEIEYHMTIGAR